MELLESTKLTVSLLESGAEKPVKQTFSNITETPSEDKVFALGNIMKALAPQYTALDTIVKTEVTRYFK